MFQSKKSVYTQTGSATRSAEVDQGLRSYMLGIYNYMASALLLTGIVALVSASSPAIMGAMYQTNEYGQIMGMNGLGWLVAFAPLGFVLLLSMRIHAMSFQTAQAAFWGFAGVMGLSLSSLFLLYTGESIARAFFVTAGTFGVMSLYGYTTKKDLTSWGSFLIMGLVGMILASLVNMFLRSSGLAFAVSVISVFIFIGLTAYDTQRLKTTYYQISGNAEMVGRVTIMGALSLYMDFINLFVNLLRFMGDRR